MFRITGLLEAVVLYIFLALKNKKKICCDKCFLLIPRHLNKSSNYNPYRNLWGPEYLQQWVCSCCQPVSDTMGSLSLIHTRIWHKSHKDKGRKSVKVLGLWEGLLPAVLTFLSVGFLQHFSHGGIKWECCLEIIWPDLPGAAGVLLHWVSSGFIESSFRALQGQRHLSEQLFVCCITVLVKKGF